MLGQTHFDHFDEVLPIWTRAVAIRIAARCRMPRHIRSDGDDSDSAGCSVPGVGSVDRRTVAVVTLIACAALALALVASSVQVAVNLLVGLFPNLLGYGLMSGSMLSVSKSQRPSEASKSNPISHFDVWGRGLARGSSRR